MESQVIITSNQNVMIVDFENKKIIFERSSGLEQTAGLLPMEINFSDITDIEIRKPGFMKAGSCNIIVKGIRYITRGRPFDMTQFPTKDFELLESTLSTVAKECGLSGLKPDGSVNAKKVVYADVIHEFETRKKCCACGHVFCYTPLDVAKNYSLQRQAKYSSIASVTGAMSGSVVASTVNQMNASNATSRIVNYNVCPSCGSRDLQILSKEEYEKEAKAKNAPAQNVVQAALSPAEELKNFKELLDMGIISQDEFDAKKKQLLGF